nr:reverse transcriptase domain-containing protein [Tanacetum cinerariifolium]
SPAIVEPIRIELPFLEDQFQEDPPEDPPEVLMADNRTMTELLQAPTEGYKDAIVIPEIAANNFALKHGLINLVQNKQFFRHDKEDPHAHIRYFIKITSTMRFFPSSKTTNLRNEITRFQQRFDESFYEAWECFNDLLRACPHHGFSELHQLDTFYNALNINDQDSLNSVAGGNFLDKIPRECLKIIESKSKVRQSRAKAVVAKVSTSSSTPAVSSEVSELKDMVRALPLDKKNQSSAPTSSFTPAPVKAVEPNCVACGDVTTSGNLTPYDDLIVSTTSPTLTLFRDNNFLLFEEADACLGLEDDPNSQEFNPFYYDPDGDILLLKAIMSSQPLPPLPIISNICLHTRRNSRSVKPKLLNLPLMNLLRLNLRTYLPISTVDYLSKWVEAKALPTNDARVVCKSLKSLFARFGSPRAIISDRENHFCNDQFAKVMLKYGVTHRLSTAYHPQTSGQVEVSNHGLKRILERTIGKNRASWSNKLDDAQWAFRTAYKTPIGCTPYKLVYVKACHLPIELEHKAYWALKQANFDLAVTGDHRKVQLNELNELCDHAYENLLIYKEKTKRIHDSKIKNRVFNVGDRVLSLTQDGRFSQASLKPIGVDLSLSPKCFHMARLSNLKSTGLISK